MESLNEIILLNTLSSWAGSQALQHFGIFSFPLSTAATSVVVKRLFRLHLASPLALCTDQEPPKATRLI